MAQALPNKGTSAGSTKLAPLSFLQVGYQLTAAADDEHGQRLLFAGTLISEDLLTRLAQQGCQQISLKERDWHELAKAAGATSEEAPAEDPATIETPATAELDAAIQCEADTNITAAPDSFKDRVREHGTALYDTAELRRQESQHQETVDQITEMVQRLNDAQEIDSEALQSLSHDTVVQAAEDMDLFISLGLDATQQRTLFENSAKISRIAVAIGTNLGLSELQLSELGAGCLVHDAGMLQVDEHALEADGELTPVQRLQIARHPIVAADLLYERMRRVPVGVRMIVYQMHERCDGSGYPRGTNSESIHYMTKIASVAEAYAALVAPSAKRKGVPPYAAIKSLLKDVSQGLFDSQAVRGLLHSISLFPIGSLVQLTDGRIAKVFRANGAAYDKPTVQAWWPNRLQEQPEVIDLRTSDLKVSRAVGQV